MPRTKQHGYVYKRGKNWCLRYYDIAVAQDGTTLRPQRSRILAEAVGEYRGKKAARELADEFLKPFNDGTYTALSGMSIVEFWGRTYLPYLKGQKRPSTVNGYEKMWSCYLENRLGAPLREFRTVDSERVLQEIVAANEVCTTTLKHIKHLMSGIFRYAIRTGVLNGVNPMQAACLPNAKTGGETHAYSLDEVLAMLRVLPQPAKAIVAIAAFCELRKGELRSLRVEDYDGSSLAVRRSAWRKHVGQPKGKRGTGFVPLIPSAATILDEHLRMRMVQGYIFQTQQGGPADLDFIVREVIRPTLKTSGLPWYGLHAFRRGLATNLHELGIADVVIQAILRHSDVSVTRKAYIKSDGVDSRSLAAMDALESAICTKHAPEPVAETGKLVIQ